MDNFISVIITIYKRKEFYKEAIESAINQTLDKKYYEIIVVHFIDIDKEYSNVKYIKCDDVNVGKQLSLGINNAKGNIISFLEDDDKFLSDKLQFIYDTFNENNNIVYLHNNYISNNKEFKNRGMDFNMSCISIKKGIINKNIEKVITSSDTFMYYSALESKNTIVRSNKKLTFYRIHDNNISTGGDTNKNLDFTIKKVRQFVILYQIFTNKKIRFQLKSRISNLVIYLSIRDYKFEDNKMKFYLVPYLFYQFHFWKILHASVYILYKHNILKGYVKKQLQ